MGDTRVAVGGYALQKAGLTPFYPGVIQQTTKAPQYHRWNMPPVVMYYAPDIDGDSRHIAYTVSSFFSKLAIPTPERAIVDNIRHQDIFEEYFLVEALKSYMAKHGDNEEGLALLRQVAEEYGQAEQLEYWLEEARNDWEV